MVQEDFMNSTQDILSEEIVLFGEAGSWVASIVASIPSSLWDGPGLGEWSLRSLVGHTSRALLTVENYLTMPASELIIESPESYYEAVAQLPKADPSAVLLRGVEAGKALGDDPSFTFNEITKRVVADVKKQRDVLLETIVGGIKLSDYLPTRTFELIVHGLDIARAVGLETPPPANSLQRSLDLAVALTAHAGDASTLLLALTGRDPLPTSYSVI